MAGLDVYAGAFGVLEQELGPRFSPPPSLSALVGAGRLGTKAGGGYLLEERGGGAPEEQRDALYVALGRLLAQRPR
jgi:3-hydroxyacyl-CoA dehydrogenase